MATSDGESRRSSLKCWMIPFFLILLILNALVLSQSCFGIKEITSSGQQKKETEETANEEEPEVLKTPPPPINIQQLEKAKRNPLRDTWLTGLPKIAPDSEQVQFTTWRNPVDTAPVPADVSRNPVLPPRLITVFGLESSGTTFTSSFLAKAIGMVKFKEGRNALKAGEQGRTRDIVMHLSLPWGFTCERFRTPVVVPVLYPQECLTGPAASFGKEDVESTPACQSLGFTSTLKESHPGRFFVNITSHLLWHRDRGVDARAVIVLRDSTISLLARFDANHCKTKQLAAIEEALGLRLINEAIETFVLGNGTTWETPLLSGNGVLLVSYESMLRLGNNYIKMIYRSLGIASKHMPFLKDGNAKYVEDMLAASSGGNSATAAARKRPVVSKGTALRNDGIDLINPKGAGSNVNTAPARVSVTKYEGN